MVVGQMRIGEQVPRISVVIYIRLFDDHGGGRRLYCPLD